MKWFLLFLFAPALAQITVPDGLFGGHYTLGLSRSLTHLIPLQRFLGLQPLTPHVRSWGPRLLFCDHPEVVGQPGVLCEGVGGPGANRVFFYALSTRPGSLYFTLLAINPEPLPAPLFVTREAFAGPAPRYTWAFAGRRVTHRFLAHEHFETLQVPGFGVLILDPQLAQKPAGFDDLVTGMLDLRTYSPIDLELLASRHPLGGTDLSWALGCFGSDPSSSCPPILRVLGGPGAGRGTFPHANRTFRVTLDGGTQLIRLASGVPPDRWIQGRDYLTGQPVQDVGNYGVLYVVKLWLQPPPHVQETLGLYAIDRGCRLSGTIRLLNPPPRDPDLLRVPTDQFGILGPRHATLIGTISVFGGVPWFDQFLFTPPGYSCLPVDILALPLHRAP
jgi:hypothetical protein